MPRKKIDLEQIRKDIKSGRISLKKPSEPRLKLERPPFAMIPLHWIPMVVEAGAQNGWALLTAIAYRMNNRSRVAIDSETWELVGPSLDRAKRRAMLVALKRVRHIVELDYSPRLGQPKYTAYKVVWWDTAPNLVAVAVAELRAATRSRPAGSQ
jgi:hypothetical protein